MFKKIMLASVAVSVLFAPVDGFAMLGWGHMEDEDGSEGVQSAVSSVRVAARTVEQGQHLTSLNAKHFNIFRGLWSDESLELRLESIEALFEVLGGTVEREETETLRPSSRVKLILPHHENANSIVRVIHVNPNPGQNSRKNLPQEHIVNIRRMLEEAGFTIESVVSKAE